MPVMLDDGRPLDEEGLDGRGFEEEPHQCSR